MLPLFSVVAYPIFTSYRYTFNRQLTVVSTYSDTTLLYNSIFQDTINCFDQLFIFHEMITVLEISSVGLPNITKETADAFLVELGAFKKC